MNKIELQPLNQVKWVHRDQLCANNYNPNKVAPVEMELLKTSIIEDGWTQPIVCNEDNSIIDGFHRWTCSKDKRIYELTDGYVPVVFLKNKDLTSKQMATIRHNRARGTHGVLEMSKIVSNMVNGGLSEKEIIGRLGMEMEEIVRLCFKEGIPKSKILQNKDFSNSWTPK